MRKSRNQIVHLTATNLAVGPDGAWNGLNTPCPAPCTAATLSGLIVVTVSGGSADTLSGRKAPKSDCFTWKNIDYYNAAFVLMIHKLTNVGFNAIMVGNVSLCDIVQLCTTLYKTSTRLTNSSYCVHINVIAITFTNKYDIVHYVLAQNSLGQPLKVA